MALKKVKLGDLLELCDERNSDLKYDLSDVRGISIKKVFIDTKADMEGVAMFESGGGVCSIIQRDGIAIHDVIAQT